MVNDDLRFGWTPVEPAGEAAQDPAAPPAPQSQGWPPVDTYPQTPAEPEPYAASIFAADPPGMGPASDHDHFPEPAPWAPSPFSEPARAQPVAEPVVAEPVVAEPVVAEPVVAYAPVEPTPLPAQPWTPIMATDAVATAPAPVSEPWTPIMATEAAPALLPPIAEPWTPPTPAPFATQEPYQAAEPQLAPSKPLVPGFAASAPVPTPIAAEEAEIIPAWETPRAPFEAAPFEAGPFEAAPAAQPLYESAPYDPPADEPLAYSAAPAAPSAPVDPVWALGAQAVEAAHLQAAGAPVQAPEASSLPPIAPLSFGEEQAFVPRFDPIGGVTSAPMPTLSFTEPAPRAPSPFSDVTVPQAEGPAYVPVMDIAQADRTHVIPAGPLDMESLPELVDEPAPFTQRRPVMAPVESMLSGVDKPWAPLADIEAPALAYSQPALADHAVSEPVVSEPAYAEAAVAEQPARPVYGDVMTDRPSFAQYETPAPAASPYAPAEQAASPFPWGPVGATEQLPTMAADPSPTLVMPAANATAAPPAYSGGGVDRLADTSRLGDTHVGTGEVAVNAAKPKRGIGRIVLWAALALVVAGGLGCGAYRLFFWPEAEILAVPTITAAAPTPTGDPIQVTDATEFGAAMPDTVATHVLMEFTATDPIGDAALPARAAEHVTLAYGSGSGSPVFTVEAFQHYTVDEATLAYDSYTEDMPDREDVEVAGQAVGERAWSTEGTGGTVVWQNSTAVFVLTGPADEVLEFFEDFGV